MKGFTLIEVLVYIAVSTIALSSLTMLSVTLIEAAFVVKNSLDAESAGVAALRIIHQKLADNQPIDVNRFEHDFHITEFNISTLVNNLKKVSFTINNHSFEAAFYAR